MLKLNIGPGENQFPPDVDIKGNPIKTWTNIDSRALKGIDHVTDMGELHMFDDDSVDVIYACHVLEHCSYIRAREVLKEWARVLRPQLGLLRVCVPDIGALCSLACNGTHLGRMRGLIWGGQSYPENTHYTGWDYQELCRDLRECGFFNITMYDPWHDLRPFVPPAYRDFSFMTLDATNCSLNLKAFAI